MKFVIDRSKWKNARYGKGWTELLNRQGYMCCLGQVCELACAALTISDDVWLSDSEREKQLTELCVKYGHELSFEGSYND